MAASDLSTSSKRPLLVFDGDCAFCSTWVERLRGALPRFPEAVPWQFLDLDEVGLSRDEVDDFAWYLTSRRQLAGHLAFSAILRSQPSLGLRFAGALLATPPISWAAAVAYRWIAANRHRLPGGTAACAVSPERRIHG